MQTNYQETEEYWEDVFAKQKVYNPHQELTYKKISKNLYQEDSGLYLYNINDGEFKDLVNSYFKIVKREEINFEEYNMINRLYYLQK